MLSTFAFPNVGFTAPTPMQAVAAGRVVTAKMQGSTGVEVTELKTIAKSLNPTVGFWDPLEFADANFFPNIMEDSNGASIRWLRHAELKVRQQVSTFATFGSMISLPVTTAC